MQTGERPFAFHVLAKPAGASCNLACRYCFYLDKKTLYRSGSLRMNDDVLRCFLRQYLTATGARPPVVAWQGGEPTLMGLDFFRRAVRYAREYARPGVAVRHTLQTNGTLLDPAWCDFLREHAFLVGISIDGPRELHDAYRVDRAGHSTFDRVLRGARLLREHGVEFNVLAAVHAANADRPLEVYRFLRDEVGARFIQLLPIVERAGPERPDQVTPFSVTPGRYGAFQNAIFDEWVRHDVGRVFVQSFDDALAAWAGFSESVCVRAPTCGNAVALEHNGDLYACDHFVDSRHLLGNITRVSLLDLVLSDRQRRFGLAKRDGLPRPCRECRFRFACHGGCPKDRFLRTADGEAGLSYLCEGYRAFFDHVDRPMRVMAGLLSRGRPAADIMRSTSEGLPGQYDAAAGPVGRNEPCPCGSGLKFKRCHGKAGGGKRADRGDDPG